MLRISSSKWGCSKPWTHLLPQTHWIKLQWNNFLWKSKGWLNDNHTPGKQEENHLEPCRRVGTQPCHKAHPWHSDRQLGRNPKSGASPWGAMGSNPHQVYQLLRHTWETIPQNPTGPVSQDPQDWRDLRKCSYRTQKQLIVLRLKVKESHLLLLKHWPKEQLQTEYILRSQPKHSREETGRCHLCNLPLPCSRAPVPVSFIRELLHASSVLIFAAAT